MLSFTLLSATLLAASAAPDTVPSLRALHVAPGTPPPTVDGKLDELLWRQAPAAQNFLQSAPSPGAPSGQRSEARVLYTQEALYVGMRMHDSAPDSVVGQLARHDAGVYSDWAHVLLSSYHDQRTAFRFATNPRGVKQDAFHFNDADQDPSWDPVWSVATRVDSLGWTAEFRIPLSQLRYNPTGKEEQLWGVNFIRHVARSGEVSAWSHVVPNSGRYVSYSGTLRNLRDLPSTRNLELQPYATARLTRAPGDPADPFHQPTEGGLSAGLDLKYGLAPDLVLTATLNPDFAQVEADPSEVNLTAFETLLSERRPFFQEGTELFNNFGLGQLEGSGGERLFYSRRIGRAPSRSLSGQGFPVEAPALTTILGALKFTGKMSEGWSLGVLRAVTAPEQARIWRDGEVRTTPVEPLTHYSMARLSRDFGEGNSTVGGVLTTTNRLIEEGSELDFLRGSAYVGGLDGRHRFGGGNYQASGFLLASRVAGSPLSLSLTQQSSARYFQRPDAHHLELDSTRTSLSGLASNLEVRKIAGGNWRWSLAGNLRTPGFETNDLGYLRTADAWGGTAQLAYHQPQEGALFRGWGASLSSGSVWNFGGERTLTALVLSGNAQMKSFWGGGLTALRIFPALSTTTLRGGPALAQRGRTIWVGNLSSDPRKALHFALDGSLGQGDESDSRAWGFGSSFTLRPSTSASLSLGAGFSRNRAPWLYLGPDQVQGETRYLGAALAQRTLSLNARLDYTLRPTLSLQLYAQPFVSAGEFSPFYEVANPRVTRFSEQFSPVPETRLSYNPDFNVRSLNSNAVLRWEYRPGSTLFLVWSQGRQGYQADGSFDVRRDLGGLFGLGDGAPLPSTHVLLLKVNYWLGR